MFTYNTIHRLSFTLKFPSGLSAGDGSFGNEMQIARNGKDQLVLRGTSLSGVLRHAYEKRYGNADLFFGLSVDKREVSQSNKNCEESPLVVSDVVLNAKESYRRTSHLRNRHTGAVLDGGLYSIESTPPETIANITFWYRGNDDNENVDVDFLKKLAGIVKDGLTFGGNSNRGVGLAEAGEFFHKKYNLSDKKEYANYLNAHYDWRNNKANFETDGEKIEPQTDTENKNLTVEFTLQIPRGQDILIADGNEMTPQTVQAVDGKMYYILLGSTLHGLFRNWITRLAARERKQISDTPKVYKENIGKTYTGEQLGWMFDKNMFGKDKDKNNRIDAGYPVESLFGSLHKAGRFHISDSLCPVNDKGELQHRKHVALDAISGGAIEGMLFDNNVLTAGEFNVKILVKDAKDYEAKWIAQTLKALDLGVLRIGSSKAAGRLELKQNPVSNKYSEIFNIKQ